MTCSVFSVTASYKNAAWVSFLTLKSEHAKTKDSSFFNAVDSHLSVTQLLKKQVFSG